MVSIMDKRIKQLSQDILKGKSLEENIPQLFNNMANQYHESAQVRLAMHYFTLYEAYYDDENTWSKDALSYIDQVNGIINYNIVGTCAGSEREKAIVALDMIRNNIMKHMEALTTYADSFQIYEYVLNRIEYRFKEEVEFIDEDELAREILNFIFDTEDNFIINEKIKEMIGQLPVRITKQKYFDIINDSIKPYLGGEASSLESYLYMLRTSAMLYKVENMDSKYPELWEKKEQLAHLDYQNLTREMFVSAKNTLQLATLILETETSVYYALQEIVNDVYTSLLCFPYAGMVQVEDEVPDDAQKAALKIISDINSVFATKEKKDIFDGILDVFGELEGVQEQLLYETDKLESAFYDVTQNHVGLVESLMLKTTMNVLKRSQNLLSNSLFVDLEEKNEVVIIDETMMASEARKLEQELKDLFNGQDRIITRAIMANTINKVPVFFSNHKEVMDYVRYSLERCSDIFEKVACMEIIREIMSE